MAIIYTILQDGNQFFIGGDNFTGYENHDSTYPILKFSSDSKTQIVELIYDGTNFIGKHSVKGLTYEPPLPSNVPA